MKAAQHNAPGATALAEAAQWFIEFRVGDADARARDTFNQWLRRSPENIQAYLQIAGTWADLSGAAPASLDVDRLLEQARTVDNVVAFEQVLKPEVRRGRPRWLALAAAAALACVAASAAWLLHGRPVRFATGIGEQRFITLSDASTIELNARSSVRVRISGEQRVVELLSGQALFDIARDPRRPFIVEAGATRIRAIGTQFDVYRKHADTTVTVLEGRVAVTADRQGDNAVATSAAQIPSLRAPLPPIGAVSAAQEQTAASAAVYLSAGERLVVTPSRSLAPVLTDVETARAWTQRRLIFDSTRLADVAEEFNRYNRRPLHVASGELKDMLISGVYSSTDPASLLRFLRHQPGVSVTETDAEIRIDAL